MKIVHIVPNHSVFNRTVFAFFENNFKEFDFSFRVARRKKGEQIQNVPSSVDVVQMDSLSHSLETIIAFAEQYDFLVFHSMFLSPLVKLAIRAKYPNILQKIVWIAWGYDVYLPNETTILGLAKNLVKKFAMSVFERQIPYFIAIHPVDQIAYKRKIKGQAKLFYAPYRTSSGIPQQYREYCPVSIKEKKAEGKPIVIQVGHRADKILRHFEVLDRLKPYAQEKIQILLPLNYGDASYGDSVANYANALFPGKTRILRDVLPMEEYLAILSDVDIFLLNSARQIALGNIHKMLLMQKKIYLPKDSVLSSYYREQEIPVCDIEEIGQVCFKEFCDEVDMTTGRQYIEDYYNTDAKEVWRSVFQQIFPDKAVE